VKRPPASGTAFKFKPLHSKYIINKIKYFKGPVSIKFQQRTSFNYARSHFYVMLHIPINTLDIVLNGVITARF